MQDSRKLYDSRRVHMYLLGLCTEVEKAEVERFIREDPEFEKTLTECKKGISQVACKDLKQKIRRKFDTRLFQNSDISLK